MKPHHDAGRSTVYSFRLRDRFTGKWRRARWQTTADEIAKLGGVIDGPPEIREPIKGYFAPFGPLVPHAVLMRIEEPTPDMQPELDQDERELLRLFLRRLVTYYARRRRFAQMGGAASLLRAL